MVKSYLFVLYLIVALPFAATSQQKHLKPLYSSEGELPKEFKTTSYRQYLLEREGIDPSLTPREKKEQTQFYIESNYWIFDLQYSGKVLFGNALYNYLNQIKNNLLVGDPGLAQKITVYPIKYASLNAFTTHAGNIYVNIGLLAHMSTEDEIAYVLAHEIAHYTEKHNMKGFVRSKKKETADGKQAMAMVYSDSVIKIHNYSQALEFQADTLGFNMLQRSKYKTRGALNALMAMAWAEFVPLQPANIQNNFLYDLMVAENYKSTENAGKQTDERVSTHPAIGQRIAEIEMLLKDDKTKSSVGFTTNAFRTQCLNLILQTYLENGEFVKAICLAAALKNEPGQTDSRYADLVVLKAFHSLTLLRHKNTVAFHGLLENELKSGDPQATRMAAWFNEGISERKMVLADLHLLMTMKPYETEFDDVAMVERSCMRLFRKTYPEFYVDIENGRYKDIYDAITEKALPVYKKYFPAVDSALFTKNLSQNDVGLYKPKSVSPKDFEKGNLLVMPSKSFFFNIPFWRGDFTFNSMQTEKVNAGADEKTGAAFAGSENRIISPYLKGRFSTNQYNLLRESSLMLRDVWEFKDFYTNADMTYISNEMKNQNLRYVSNTYSLVFKENAALEGGFETAAGIIIWPLLYPGIRHLVYGHRYQYIYSIVLDVEKGKMLEYSANHVLNNKSPKKRITKHQKRLAKAMNH